jgi:hypothetical protein
MPLRRIIMSDPIIHTVELPPPPPPTKLERERRAFLRLLPDLLKTHKGKYVAVHEKRVVGEGDNLIDVAREAYGRYGYIPIYVDLVTDEPVEPIRIPHFRVINPDTPS